MNKGKLVPLEHGTPHHCFGCGQQNKTGLGLKFFVDDERCIVSHVRVPRRFEGPPGYAHGGVIATLLDEAMSKANRQFGVVAMTRQMEIEYLKPVPLLTPVELHGSHLRTDGRKHFCEARIVDKSGTILASGKALFLEVK